MSLGAAAPSLTLHKLKFSAGGYGSPPALMQYPPSVAASDSVVPSFFQCVCELVHTCTRGGAVNLKRSAANTNHRTRLLWIPTTLTVPGFDCAETTLELGTRGSANCQPAQITEMDVTRVAPQLWWRI